MKKMKSPMSKLQLSSSVSNVFPNHVFRRTLVSRSSCSIFASPLFRDDRRRVVTSPTTTSSCSVVSVTPRGISPTTSTTASTILLSASPASSTPLSNIFFSIALFKNPTSLSPLLKYSINAIKTSNHCPLSTGLQKLYNLVEDKVTPLVLEERVPVSWICSRYVAGKVAWYNWKEVC